MFYYKKSKKIKILAFLINLILLLNIMMYQTLSVYGMVVPPGNEVFSNLSTENLWTVIEGGGNNLESQIIQNPSLFSAQIDSNIALGTVAKQAFWDEMNATIRQKIENGTLSSEDVGVVYYKNFGGTQLPIAIVHNAIYGSNEYLITRELADKIIDEQLQTEADVQAAVLDYWDRVVASDVQPFIDIADNLSNWVTKFTDKTQDVFNEVYWKLFGIRISSLSADFLQDGIWCRMTNKWDTVYTYTVGDSYINNEYQYMVVHVTDISSSGSWGEGRCGYYLWYYDPSWNDFRFRYVTGIEPVVDDIKSVVTDPWFYRVSRTDNNDYEALIDNTTWPVTIPFERIFPNWGEIGRIYLPNNDPDLNPLINPDACYGVDDIAEAVGIIETAVDTALEEDADAVPVLNPETLPELAPVLDPDRGLNPDTGLNPGRFPEPVPGSGGENPPGGGDEPPGSGGDGGDDKPGERPTLKVPQLLTLFPFCIPFDIKKAIQLFSADGSNPVFNIPIHIEYGGHVIVDYTFVLDLSGYGISTAVGYIKAVEIIAYVIVLCWATSKVIF